MLRVRADIIDRLVNEAGEVSIARARIESELRALKANLLELTGSVIRLRTQVREIEIQAESQIQSRLMQVGEGEEGFDPLEFDRYTRFQELARSLGEGVNDVSTVHQSLLKNLDVADAALSAQGRLARDVQQQLFSIRTVPFGSLSERLYRILRGTARELGKRANLEIRGAQTELDRAVLEKLVGPLEHLLRNALDHGIEARGQRAKAGKSETGEITLTVRQVANEIAIELADDGAGLNLEGVRAKAVAQGRIAADAQPSDAQLIECIFQPGFSTASKVTQVSGRGIGMDVVRSEIMTLGGRVEVSTRPGHGTTFLLYLPLTLAVAQAVMVRAGGRLWALPAPMVEQVQHVKADVLVNFYVQRRVENQGLNYPFHYLPRLLGDPQQIPESTRNNPVLLLRSGQNVAAIHVDEMIGNQEVVVKNIGPQLARVSGIAGATVLGNGEVVLIINPVQLAQRADVPEFDPNAERVAPEVPKMAVVQAGRPLVMIVDDSLTVRRITSRLLPREGFDVLTARDGVDALELLETETPDVILLDIEMPRMDGFEFTKNIKAKREYRAHPDRDDHVADRGKAPEPREGSRRRSLPRQALPGRGAAAAPARDAGADDVERQAPPAGSRRTAGIIRRDHHRGVRSMANYATGNIRTVALVGQGGSGKTTLTEALLLASGAIKEAGTVERGTDRQRFRSAGEGLAAFAARVASCISTRRTRAFICRHSRISRFHRAGDRRSRRRRDCRGGRQRAVGHRDDRVADDGLGGEAPALPARHRQQDRRRERRSAGAARVDPVAVRQGVPADQSARRRRQAGRRLLLQSRRRVRLLVGEPTRTARSSIRSSRSTRR